MSHPAGDRDLPCGSLAAAFSKLVRRRTLNLRSSYGLRLEPAPSHRLVRGSKRVARSPRDGARQQGQCPPQSGHLVWLIWRRPSRPATTLRNDCWIASRCLFPRGGAATATDALTMTAAELRPITLMQTLAKVVAYQANQARGILVDRREHSRVRGESVRAQPGGS